MRAQHGCLSALGVGVLSAMLFLSGCAKSDTGSGGDAGVTKPDGGGGSGSVGQPCTTSQDCDEGICLGVGAEMFCTLACGTCPEGSYCGHVDPSGVPDGEQIPQSGYYCLPDRGGLCRPCDGPLDCPFPSDQCLSLTSGERACGRDCSFDGTCPDGYECIDGQCHPTGGTCECNADRIGAVRSCSNSNTFGTCMGKQTCYIAGWDECDARTPGPEACNGVDDDCDGEIPADEVDADGNGVLDCLESCQPQPEVCDLQDNDCNGQVDDGSPQQLCGQVPNGTPRCEAGSCVIDSCSDGYADLDGQYDNGCECAVTASGGPTCDQAEDLGQLDDSGQTQVVSGILGADGEVWYRVRAVDLPDSGLANCDTFHFRVQFLTNPDDSYRMEVYEGDCTQAPSCTQAITDFAWYTNHREGSGESAVGECPCLDDPTTNGEGYNQCQDDTRVFFIRVFKVQGGQVNCTAFDLELSNGVYSP